MADSLTFSPETVMRALRLAYATGWTRGVQDFAIWKDGEQLVGCRQRPIKEVLSEGPEPAVIAMDIDRMTEALEEMLDGNS